MKVIVTLEIDVDSGAWTENYGVRGAGPMRRDVKEYVKDAVRDQIAAACDSHVQVTVR